jgi:hypothetical protein
MPYQTLKANESGKAGKEEANKYHKAYKEKGAYKQYHYKQKDRR